METRAHDTPSEVCAEDGEVMVEGPDGIAVSFTPDAASETSQRLLDGAVTARGQQLEKYWESKRRPGRGEQ